MKKITILLAFIGMIGLQSCTGPQGNQGVQGPETVAEVFELRNVDFGFDASNGYSIYQTLIIFRIYLLPFIYSLTLTNFCLCCIGNSLPKSFEKAIFTQHSYSYGIPALLRFFAAIEKYKY